MYIAGRWVSPEIVSTIFILWAVAATALGVAVWWLGRRRPPPRAAEEKVPRRRRATRHKR